MSDGNELDGTTQDLKALESVVRSTTGAIEDLGKSSKSASNGILTGGGGTRTGPMLGNALANFTAQPTGDGQATGMNIPSIGKRLGLGTFGVLASAIPTGIDAMYKGMPDVQQTIDRATHYYNAGIYGGMAGGSSRMQAATFSAMRGGITSLGSDARAAEYLQSRGMTQSKSNYLGTVSAVSNAAKYLNMSNERSAVALEGLTSGKTSSDLLRNLGIYTSDPRSGQAKSQSQIFGEIANRLTAGQSMATVDQVNESFRRGKLGASLSGLGLSEDQQNMMHMYMVARAQGVNLDLTDQKQMDAFAKKNGLNPASTGYQSLTYDTKAMNDAQQNYIQATKDALPIIKGLSDAAGAAAASLPGSIKAFSAAVQGSTAGAAAFQAAESIVTTALTALAGGLGSLFVGMGGGGGPIGGGGKPAGKFGKFMSVAGKVGGAVGAVGGVIGAVGTGMMIASNADQATVNGQTMKSMQMSKTDADAAASMAAWTNAMSGAISGAGSGAALGATIGSFIEPGGGTLVGGIAGGLIGGIVGGASSFFSTYNNTMSAAGYGGTNSTINAQGPTGTGQQNTVKFTWPAGNASLVSDGFGPRVPPKPGASSYHQGIDISVGMGTPIMASADGEVIQSGNNGDYGNCVQIKHANGYVTLYGHQSRIATSMGKKVVQGQVIGYVGSTGTSTGAHLHFGVKDASGKFIDPMKVLNGTASATYGSQSSASASGSSSPASDMAGISDSRAKAGIMTVSSYRGAEVGGGGANSGFKTMAMGSNSQTKDTMALGTGASGKNNLTSNTMGIYLPGARRAKTGDPYVANDGPVNVHSGEAILTSEQAEVWRTALKQGGLGKSGGNNVTINLSIAQASETEARRFASLVKDLLEKDTLIKNMGMK
jgi:murein DD-endopeptidase MepM/ murein hydrolase activator NlpD